MDTVSVGADAQLAYVGGRRSQDRLPLLTDPLEGGEGSCCRVCGGHADDDPLRGLVGGGSRRVRRRGHGEQQAQERQPKLPRDGRECLGQFHRHPGLGLSNRI